MVHVAVRGKVAEPRPMLRADNAGCWWKRNTFEWGSPVSAMVVPIYKEYNCVHKLNPSATVAIREVSHSCGI